MSKHVYVPGIDGTMDLSCPSSTQYNLNETVNSFLEESVVTESDQMLFNMDNVQKDNEKRGPKMGPVLEAPWGALLGRSWDYDTGGGCNSLPSRRPGEG